MDPWTRLLIRMAQWLRHPPSRRHAIVMAVAVGIALAIGLFERVFGWPDWLRTEPVPIRRS